MKYTLLAVLLVVVSGCERGQETKVDSAALKKELKAEIKAELREELRREILAELQAKGVSPERRLVPPRDPAAGSPSIVDKAPPAKLKPGWEVGGDGSASTAVTPDWGR